MSTTSSSPEVVFGDGSYKVVTMFAEASYFTGISSSSSAAVVVDEDDAAAAAAANSNSSAEKSLFIAYPSVDDEAKFGVLLFLHGYMLPNTFYSQLMKHVASHGFIVVAPQVYKLSGFDSTNDIKVVAKITEGIKTGSLDKVLPSNIVPDLTRVALTGHSRGGRDAFALALGVVAFCSLKLSALIGIDPVAGTVLGQTNPKILTYDGHAFDGLHGLPVMVIGSGIDAEKCSCVSCTPKGVNYSSFYDECKKPACYFVVKGQGHLDVLDEDTSGIIGLLSHYMCNKGMSREPMRRFVGGALITYLTAYLENDDTYLKAFRDGTIKFPVEFDEINFKI